MVSNWHKPRTLGSHSCHVLLTQRLAQGTLLASSQILQIGRKKLRRTRDHPFLAPVEPPTHTRTGLLIDCYPEGDAVTGRMHVR